MEDDWDFSRLVKEAPIRVVGISDFFSHLYKSHTLLIGVWYGGSVISWDRNGFVESIIGAADPRGRLGLGPIRSAQSPRWEEIEGNILCLCLSEEDGPCIQKVGQA